MMKALGTNKLAMLAAFGIAVCAPLAALADPATGVWSGDGAAPVPHIPGTFAGSPTNDDPSAGQFTLNFDGTGRFTGTGRTAEPPATIEVTPAVERHQIWMTRGAQTSLETEATFSRFRAQLRTIARQPPAVPQTAQR